MHKSPTKKSRSFINLFIILFMFCSTAIFAKDLLVTSLADSGSGSLRDCIAKAKSGDTIHFDKRLYDSTINLDSQIIIDKRLEIDGPKNLANHPENIIIISGQNKCRIFYIINPHLGDPKQIVTLNGLILTNGHAPDGFKYGCPGDNGGAIYITKNANVNIVNCNIIYNTAGNGHAAVSFWLPNGAPGGNGGAIYSEGKLNISNCTLKDNFAGNGRDGISSHRGANGGVGGAICQIGSSLTVMNSAVEYNKSGKNGYCYSQKMV